MSKSLELNNTCVFFVELQKVYRLGSLFQPFCWIVGSREEKAFTPFAFYQRTLTFWSTRPSLSFLKVGCAFVFLNMTYKKLFIGELRTIFLSIWNRKLKTAWEQRSAVRDIHVCFLHDKNVVILFSSSLL